MAEANALQAPPNANTFGLHQTISENDPLYLLIVEAFHYPLHNGLIAPALQKPNFPGNTNDFIVSV
jgi:hypothetical protein